MSQIIEAAKRLFCLLKTKKCPKCRRPFSDWFVWHDGNRHCFACWANSVYSITVLEDGRVIDATRPVKLMRED